MKTNHDTVSDRTPENGALCSRVTATTIRADYAHHSALTLAEAGKIAGVGPQAVRAWLRGKCIKRARRVGPFVVDHQSLLAYLQSGELQA